MKLTTKFIALVALSWTMAACNGKANDTAYEASLTKRPVSIATAKAATQNNEPAASHTKNNTKKNNTMSTIEMTKEMFLEKVADYRDKPNEFKYLGDKPCIIDFYATWCGPCRQTAPRLEEIAGKYGDKLYVYKVDVDQQQELAALFRVRSIPTILFIPMNGQPQMAVGALGSPELEDAVRNILKIQ